MSDLLITKNLQFLMTTHGFSATSLQMASGITQSTTSRILKGETTNPRNRVLKSYADFFNISIVDLCYKDLSLDITNVNVQTLNQEPPTKNIVDVSVPQEGLKLKTLPIFDMDNGVKYTLNENIESEIAHINESTITTPVGSRAFGIKMTYDLIGVAPTTIHTNDILIIEPCLPPNHGDLVLLRLEHSNAKKRGTIARLFTDVHGNYFIQDSKNEPQPAPINSIICGVVSRIVRDLIDSRFVSGRIDTHHKPIVIGEQ